ncbi:methyltransferase family protein [Microbaculum marinisediminis]|uniref:Isoprenylcysteine carboxylmethyltransferase family protein n=1 Tax=Microbaculum marinisediminis TaxID=2931392 RepID=A0AAW5R2G3_9HYPH|nr:isoprenylcysteine carboxylmethyltransferase family protein [Microbaculum sp. A6E488]MCT8974019.1 isoprenylcysteine carboxylmethyltransferase family protein [Microbaculum sp. A6E488]
MLKNELVRQGNWLFRWRSYLPLVIVPVAVIAFMQSDWVNRVLGDTVEDVWDYACFAIAFSGLVVRGLIVGFVPRGTSGRTSEQKAEALNTTGMYSQMRHPLYFANFLVFLGFMLVFKSVVFVLFGTVAYFLYYERIMLAEEAFLEDKYGDRYRRWAEKTPVFLPRLSGWVRPALPFSFKTVLRREYPGFYLITIFFFVVEWLEAFVLDKESFVAWIAEEPAWLAFLVVGTFTYVGLRVARKHTSWLAVAGR